MLDRARPIFWTLLITALLLALISCGGETLKPTGTYRSKITRRDTGTIVQLCYDAETKTWASSAGTITVKNEDATRPWLFVGRWDACDKLLNEDAVARLEDDGFFTFKLNATGGFNFINVVNAIVTPGRIEGEVRGLEKYGFPLADYLFVAEHDGIRRGKIYFDAPDRLLP